MWTNTTDLMIAIYDAHHRLRSNETDAATAHAESRLLGTATKVMAIQLEHARLTNRLVDQSAILPPITLDVKTSGTTRELESKRPDPKLIPRRSTSET